MARAPTIAGSGTVIRVQPVRIPVPAGAIAVKGRYYKRILQENIVVTIRQNTRLRVEGTIPSIDASVKPSDITNFQATAASATEVILTWTPPSAGGLISSIELNRRTPPTTGTYGGNLLTEPTAALTMFDDTTVVADTQYQYRIRGVSGTSNGDYTNDTVTTPPDTVTVGKPINFVAVRVSNTGIDLSWAAGPGNAPTGYELDRSLNGTSGWLNILADNTPPLATSFQHRGLNPNTTYYYRVRAFVGAISSSYATTSANTSDPGLFVWPGPPLHPTIGPRWHSGIGSIGENWASARLQWEGEAGRPMTVAAEWTGEQGASDWAEFEQGGTSKFTACMRDNDDTTPIVHVWPLLANTEELNTNAHAQQAAGAFEDHWDTALSNMKTRVQNQGRALNTIIFDLGHEATGTWYAWRVRDGMISQYKDSFAWAVEKIREAQYFPNALIVWRPARRYGGQTRTITAAQCYPGNAVVDILSRSMHDKNPSVDRNQPSTWDRQLNAANYPTDRNIGLQDIADLARSNGKKIGFTEWGTPIVDCGGDDIVNPAGPTNGTAYWFEKVYEFMAANQDIMIFDTHFSNSCERLWGTRSNTPADPLISARHTAGKTTFFSPSRWGP